MLRKSVRLPRRVCRTGSRRRDGTTAAERFFGQEHPDVFGWLLERLPGLPRPAAKRPKPAAEGCPGPGSSD